MHGYVNDYCVCTYIVVFIMAYDLGLDIHKG